MITKFKGIIKFISKSNSRFAIVREYRDTSIGDVARRLASVTSTIAPEAARVASVTSSIAPNTSELFTFSATSYALKITVDAEGPFTIDLTGNAGTTTSVSVDSIIERINATFTGSPASKVGEGENARIKISGSIATQSGIVSVDAAASNDCFFSIFGDMPQTDRGVPAESFIITTNHQITVTVDDAGPTELSIKGDDTGYTTAGYQNIKNTGTLGIFGSATVPAIPSETYDIDITVDGTLHKLAVALLVTDTWAEICTKVQTALRAATSKLETVKIVGSYINIASVTPGATSSILIAAGTTGSSGGDLLTAVNALADGEYVISLQEAIPGSTVAYTSIDEIISKINGTFANSAVKINSGVNARIKVSGTVLTSEGIVTIAAGTANALPIVFNTTTLTDSGVSIVDVYETVPAGYRVVKSSGLSSKAVGNIIEYYYTYGNNITIL